MRKHQKLILLISVSVFLLGWLFYWRAHRYDERAVIAAAAPELATAYFAGGCFWCTEADFEKLPGVINVISGYSGGHLEHPTYTEVLTETTGHRETVEVRYDPKRVTYYELVRYFFSIIDPVDSGGQFIDRGESYSSAIFYRLDKEREIAEEEIATLNQSGVFDRPIATKVLPFDSFWPAEEYHQRYHIKNPVRYEYYRSASGRNVRITQLCELRAKAGVPCVKI